MKKFTYLLFATLLATPAVFSQAKSDVVGYITLDCPANSDARWGLPMERKSVASAVLSSAPASNILTSSSSAFGDFTSSESHYVMFTSGAKEGLIALITANTATSITVSPQTGQTLIGIVATDTFDVIPFWTPITLFANTSVPAGTELQFFQSASSTAGANISSDLTLTFDGANWKAGFLPDNNYEIYPYEGFIVRNQSNSPISTIIEGFVPTSNNYIGIDKLAPGLPQDNTFTLANPVNENIGGLTFPQSSSGDEILIFDNSATGFNKSASTTLTFNGSSWMNGFLPANIELEGGHSFIYRRHFSNSTGTTAIRDEQDYIQNL